MSPFVSIEPPPVLSFPCPRHVEAYGSTDVGRVRRRNEDAFVVLPRVGLFAVADGIGGVAGGDVAARILVTALREAFDDPDTTRPATAMGDDAQRRRLLTQGIERANREIQSEALRSRRKGMGTTFAGVLVTQDQVTIAHVGDSRVYRLRGRHLEQLTEDHSFVNECLQQNLITLDDIARSRVAMPNLLARSVGAEKTIKVDTRFEAAAPNDVYLVCTDGLCGLVKDNDIAAILWAESDPREAVHKLIQRANEQGGFDNITAVVVRLAR